jgi:hypothetical protein
MSTSPAGCHSLTETDVTLPSDRVVKTSNDATGVTGIQHTQSSEVNLIKSLNLFFYQITVKHISPMYFFIYAFVLNFAF